MKKNLLYIGNKIYNHGYNKTAVETLGVFLAADGFLVSTSSSKKNQILRLFDMMATTFVKARKVDFILIDTYSTSSFWYAFFCSQIARFWRVKYIPILHGGNLPNRLKNNPYLCRLIFRNAYVNVAPSNYLLEQFKAHGFENIVYIPNSIELDTYGFLERTKIKPNLLWVRAFASIYNPEMAVHVFKLIQEKYPEATLTMVGPDKDGSLVATKKLATDLQLQIHFTGKLSKKEWTDLSSGCDVFINTTHFDNTPVSVLEAMALGLVVVSTNVGGIPYLLKHQKTALLVADNDVNQMVEYIDYALQNAAHSKEIIQNARAFVVEMDWHIVKLKWKKLLKDCLKN